MAARLSAKYASGLPRYQRSIARARQRESRRRTVLPWKARADARRFWGSTLPPFAKDAKDGAPLVCGCGCGVQRSFVGSPWLCQGLRCLRMTAGYEGQGGPPLFDEDRAQSSLLISCWHRQTPGPSTALGMTEFDRRSRKKCTLRFLCCLRRSAEILRWESFGFA
jgi:hypothetical protein